MKIYKIAAETILEQCLRSSGLIAPPPSTPDFLMYMSALNEAGKNGITRYNDPRGFVDFINNTIALNPSFKGKENNIAIVLGGLASLLGSDPEQYLLSPYSRAISIASGVTTFGSPNLPSTMQNDIIAVINTFGTGMIATTKVQQYPMFNTLYRKFNREIANVASASGNAALAGALSSGGLLNGRALYAAANLPDAVPSMGSDSEQIINEIFRSYSDLKYTDRNFNEIRETMMNYYGIMSAEDVRKVKEEREEEEKNRLTTATTTLPVTMAKPFNPTGLQMIDGTFLTAMHVFFAMYYQKYNALPDR